MGKKNRFKGFGKSAICLATGRKGKRRWWQLFWRQLREENKDLSSRDKEKEKKH